jgi:hypothetical protein
MCVAVDLVVLVAVAWAWVCVLVAREISGGKG